jgi:hypothetical protein
MIQPGQIGDAGHPGRPHYVLINSEGHCLAGQL